MGFAAFRKTNRSAIGTEPARHRSRYARRPSLHRLFRLIRNHKIPHRMFPAVIYAQFLRLAHGALKLRHHLVIDVHPQAVKPVNPVLLRNERSFAPALQSESGEETANRTGGCQHASVAAQQAFFFSKTRKSDLKIETFPNVKMTASVPTK